MRDINHIFLKLVIVIPEIFRIGCGHRGIIGQLSVLIALTIKCLHSSAVKSLEQISIYYAI